MDATRKHIGAFSASTFIVGSLLFIPSASAYIVVDEPMRPSASTREQEQIQLQLAEKTRDLADQYTSRRFGTEEEPLAEEPEAMEVQEEPADAAYDRASLQRQQRERFTTTEPSSADMAATYSPPVAEVAAEPVAQNLPKLPSSGAGISLIAVALGLTGAIKGRKKFEGALS